MSSKGYCLMKVGKLDEGLDSIEKALQLNPKYSLAWGVKGEILERKGKMNEALSCYEKGLESNPNDRQLQDMRKNLELKQKIGF